MASAKNVFAILPALGDVFYERGCNGFGVLCSRISFGELEIAICFYQVVSFPIRSSRVIPRERYC